MSAMSDVATAIEEAFDAEGAASVATMLGVLTELPDDLVRSGLTVAMVIEAAEMWLEAGSSSTASADRKDLP